MVNACQVTPNKGSLSLEAFSAPRQPIRVVSLSKTEKGVSNLCSSVEEKY